MAYEKLSRVQTQDRDINQIQSNIARILDPLSANPVTNGNTLTDVALTSGSNTIYHGLNRTLLGWIITRINAAETIYDTQASNTTPDETLMLTASGTVTVNIYVF